MAGGKQKLRSMLISLISVVLFIVSPISAFGYAPVVAPHSLSFRQGTSCYWRGRLGRRLAFGTANPGIINAMGPSGTSGEEIAAGKLWDGLSKKAIHTATVTWVKKMVIGLDLCPFALESMPGLKVVVADVSGRSDAVALVRQELILLEGSDKAKPATTLIVLPQLLFKQLRAQGRERDGSEEDLPEELANFEAFLDFVTDDCYGELQKMKDAKESVGDALLLSFHPDSTYSEIPNDPADFALRSPFPVVHLLRACDVEAAEQACEAKGSTTEDIALQNEARLRGEGYRELSKMLQDILSKAFSKA